MLYDLFICHASEDKADFVRPLAEALRAEHIEVWYDDFSLEIGDSIRRSIDLGLRQSRFGVVVLSPAFFAKQWTQYELDGLTEIEMRGRDKVLLPVWHHLSHADVLSFSPPLANRKAVASSAGVSAVVDAIVRVVRPQGSPLIAARDVLLEWGVTPPVITDPYWLDVTAASNRANAFGASIPDDSIWDRWSFPLPENDGSPEKWGERLAWTALQMAWCEEAERRGITPLTPPAEVVDFIQSQPGLLETCEMFPRLLVEYAPQLTIPGMSGVFEELFADLYEESIAHHAQLRREGSRSGIAITTDGEVPRCDEEWALRHLEFGSYDSGIVACEYFTGGIFGPPVSPYEHADHLFWLLSDASEWLPPKIHDVLLHGMIEWGVWLWSDGEWPDAGRLAHALYDSDQGKRFVWSTLRKNDVLGRARASIDLLGLPDSAESLLARFVATRITARWLTERTAVRRRSKRGE